MLPVVPVVFFAAKKTIEIATIAKGADIAVAALKVSAAAVPLIKAAADKNKKNKKH